MKKYFKTFIFGLIFALISIFALSSSSFMCVKVNAVEGEIQEEEEGTVYTYEDEYGAAYIIFYDNGLCYMCLISDEEVVDGYLQYQFVGDFVILINESGEELVIMLDETTMTFEPAEAIEIPGIGNDTTIESGEVIEEPLPEIEIGSGEETEEKELIGFIEENWEIFVASCGGTLAALATLLFYVLKFIKQSKDCIDGNNKNKNKNEENSNNVANVVIKVDETTEKINKLEVTLNEKYENLYQEQVKKNEEQKQQIEELSNTINNMCKAFIVMIGNNENLVVKGIAEKVTTIIKPKESDSNEKQEL